MRSSTTSKGRTPLGRTVHTAGAAESEGATFCSRNNQACSTAAFQSRGWPCAVLGDGEVHVVPRLRIAAYCVCASEVKVTFRLNRHF